MSRAINDDDDDFDEEEEENDDDDGVVEVDLPDSSREQFYSPQQIESLTVSQLKQQLRLRGLKVSGRKGELVQRFLQHQMMQQSGATAFPSSSILGDEEDDTRRDRARRVAAKNGKEFVDVSDYVEEEDQGKDTKTWTNRVDIGADGEDKEEEEENKSTEPEVWGAEARIVDEYEDGRLVVDCLSQSIVEFPGSNQSAVQAFVVASRDALKPFLAGGRNPNGTRAADATPAEERLREIQLRRERANRRPLNRDDEFDGPNDGDETGLYTNALHRDFSDWGKYTTTGAQLSAAEVQGVLLLSDVYGPFTDNTRALAEKIAFECQPVVVMAPDLFREKPWTGPTSGVNEEGQSYEEWRSQNTDELRVNVDIRAAAACLRERFGVNSVVVWGTCYGGGRALEAAAGWLPDQNIHDVDGSVGPPPVEPMACVAWYPTRYHLSHLFGAKHYGAVRDLEGNNRTLAIMGVFAGNDVIPGATKQDAQDLKEALIADTRVKDHMIKIFPDQDHGFAHQGLGTKATDNGEDDGTFGRFVDEEFGGAGQISFAEGDAEVACLLSTAFFETYSRVFLPTTGPPISAEDSQWSQDLDMKDSVKRNVRQELKDAEDNFVEDLSGGISIDPSDPDQVDQLMEVLINMQTPEQRAGPYAIEEDDDLYTMYAKHKEFSSSFELW